MCPNHIDVHVVSVRQIFHNALRSRNVYYALLGMCGGYFNSPNGIITSPSYPKKYPYNENCVYKISQPEGTFVSITVMVLDLFDDGLYHCGSSEGYDQLEIRDGSSEESALIGTFCGNVIPTSLHSTQNQMWIR